MNEPNVTTDTAEASAAPTPGSGIDYGLFLDCIHCGLCTSACPTYLETGNENDSPRGRIYLMRGVVDGRMAMSDRVRRHLDLCLDCRACETACPSGVQYGRLIEPFRIDLGRADAADHRKPGGWFERWVLYGLFPYPRRMAWALWPARVLQSLRLDRLLERTGLPRLLPAPLQRMQRLLPRLKSPGRHLPELLPAVGKRRARVGLFTGCVADALFRHTHWATARVLQANGCEVVVPRGQGCCGAIHYHSGAAEPAIDFFRENASAFPEDLDAVIVNVAGCGSMLKDYGHVAGEQTGLADETIAELAAFAGRVRDVSEFLVELGPRPPTEPVPYRATYHDACHLLHAQGVGDAPRQLLALVPELELVPLLESEICCGAAGSYNLTEADMSDRLAARKVRHIIETGAELVITGNAGCAMQLEAALRLAGHSLPVAHPMDILDRSYRAAQPSASSPSAS